MVYLNQHEFADSNQQHAFVRLRADHLATLGVKNIIEISEKDFEKWKKFIRDNKLTFINVAVTDPLYKAAMEDARQFVPKYTTIESLNYQTTYDIFSTPRVFVLDKDKKIIAKSISVSQLEEFIDRLQGFEDLPKIFPPDPEEDEQMH